MIYNNGVTNNERMIKLRKVYSIEEDKVLAWGYDKFSGFFLQIFDESDPEKEVLLVNADQGQIRNGYTIAKNDLTFDYMVSELGRNSDKATKDFKIFIESELEEPLYGYDYNSEGYHNGKKEIKTYEDLFKFFDNVELKFVVTDLFDSMVLGN